MSLPPAMRRPSARCRAPFEVVARSLSPLLPFVILAGLAWPASPQSRLGLAPNDRAEADLRETLAKRRTVADLRAVSARNTGTMVSGLAQIAAGYAALGSSNASDAVTAFRHKDVAATELGDLAAFAEAEALEKKGNGPAAADAYRRAVAFRPAGIVSCEAIVRGSEQSLRAGDAKAAASMLEGSSHCPPSSELLARLAEARDAVGDVAAAARVYDRLDLEYPASSEALAAGPRLQSLSSYLPARTPAERAQRALHKAIAVFDARDYRRAAVLLRALKPTGEDRWLVATRLGRALASAGRGKEADATLRSVPSTSVYGAEAAYQLGRQKKGAAKFAALRSVANRFPKTPFAEDALLALATEAQRVGDDAGATALYRQILDGYPEGRYVDRALWRVSWADYKAGRLEAAATALEAASRRRTGNAVAGFLYWAGRARADMGQADRARSLYEDAVRRFKVHYYGSRAVEALSKMPPRPLTSAVLRAPGDSRLELPDTTLARVRQLALIERYEAAVDELEQLPPSTASRAAIAWIESRRGRLRPAIIAMKGAFPEYLGEGGDYLPEDVWRVIYPLEFRDTLEERADRRGLDPALLAALVCQESTFDPNAVSRAGARGLMQIMPATGRALARSLGRVFKTLILHEPEVSLDFGSLYLSNMLRRFDGRVERTLAAYNAGPGRVDAWTAKEPEMSSEEFVETIPFSETRTYVMTILAAQAQYRRLYWDGEARSASGPGQP